MSISKITYKKINIKDYLLIQLNMMNLSFIKPFIKKLNKIAFIVIIAINRFFYEIKQIKLGTIIYLYRPPSQKQKERIRTHAKIQILIS